MSTDGSRLFEIHTHHPGDVRYFPHPDYVEPIDPPRFLIGDLPAEIRDDFAANGEPDRFDVLGDLGIESLEWRQPLRHLEYEWVSQDVFDAWCELAPNVESIRSFVFTNGQREQRYHAVGAERWPPRRTDDDGRAWTYWVLDEHGDPLVEPGQSLPKLLRSSDDPLTIYYPSWLDRDDVMMWLGHPKTVTEGFVERWRETDISKMLRAADFETDLAFLESNGQLYGNKKHHHREIKFRWLEMPQPDHIDGPSAV